MNTPKNYLLALLALTTVSGVAWSWHQSRELQRLRSAGGLSENERAEWEKRLAAAEKRRGELERQLEAMRGRDLAPGSTEESENAPEVYTLDGGQPGSGGPRRDPRAGGGRSLLNLMENPQFAQAWNTQQKAALDDRFATLFKKLNLPPEKLDALKSLLVEKQSAAGDVFAAARAQGVDGRESRDELRQLIATTQAEVDASIRALIGEEGYAQYVNYEQTSSQRQMVSQLDNRLSYSGAPLLESQAEQLVRILAEASSPAGGSGNSGMSVMFAGPGGPGGPGSSFGGSRGVAITDEVITRASSILAPAQLDALKQLQAEQTARRQMFQQVRDGAPRSDSSGNTSENSPSGRRTFRKN